MPFRKEIDVVRDPRPGDRVYLGDLHLEFVVKTVDPEQGVLVQWDDGVPLWTAWDDWRYVHPLDRFTPAPEVHPPFEYPTAAETAAHLERHGDRPPRGLDLARYLCAPEDLNSEWYDKPHRLLADLVYEVYALRKILRQHGVDIHPITGQEAP